MKYVDFIKMIPNNTALSNTSFATILTNIFAKQSSFLFSYFVIWSEKTSEWYYRRNKNCHNFL